MKGWLFDHITLTWREGELTADKPDILQVIIQRVKQLEELKAFILCPETHRFYMGNYLAEPLSAYLVLKHILDSVYEGPDKRDLVRISGPSYYIASLT